MAGSDRMNSENMKQRLILIFLGLTLALPATGNVFWRWRAGTGHSVFETTPNWQRVYQSNIRINGSQGRLEIMKCNDPLPAVMARLKNAFPAAHPDSAFRHSESAGAGLIQTGDTVTRLLALSLGAPDQSVVFVLTQSAAEYEQSLKPPATHLLNTMPVYPGSTATAFIADEETSAQLEISSAGGRPESIRAFFDSAFAKKGYHRMHSTGGYAGLDIFQKGMSLCCVLVQDSPQARDSTITVLHKQFRME